MTKSTFYADGYRDGVDGTHPCPPAWPRYANEYWEGYWAAIRDHHA
jgi:hypothetical protein